MAKKVLVAIPTFNRGELITLTARHLRRIAFDPAVFSFLVSDDCSTEYGLDFLEKAYGELPHVTFRRTSRHTEAIGHVWVLLRFFKDTDFDKILVCDSDLIVHESCLESIAAFDAEPVSSLYNSCFHEIAERHGAWCTKADIGWAGALIDRSVVREMFALHGSALFDDWALCDFARRRNLTIKVSVPSTMEHIGVVGMNNVVPEYFDHSFDFPREHIDQATRDHFLQRHGFDLLRHLEAKAQPATADSLRVFRLNEPGPAR